MKITLDSIGSGYNLDTLNANFTKIAAALNDRVLWRDNPPGETNSLITAVDANGKRIYNLGAPISPADAVRLQDVQSMVVGIVPASLVPFTPYGNLSATSVQGAIQELDDEKLSDTFTQVGASGTTTIVDRLQTPSVRYAKEYLAAGDGVTNDAAALNTALATEAMIDGEGKTYRVDSTLRFDGKHIKLRNAILDFSNMPASSTTYGLDVRGTQTNEQLLTANSTTGDYTIDIVNASGYAAEDWIWLQSDGVWDVGTGTYIGFISRVRKVSGNTLTLYEQIPYGLLTTENAKVYKLSMITPYFENVTIKGIRFENPGTYSVPVTHRLGGIRIDKAVAARVINCNTYDNNYAGVINYRSAGTIVQGCRFNRAMAPGLSYGVTVAGGSLFTIITNNVGREFRHGTTVGDNDGINRFTMVTQNHFHEMRDAGVDSHAASDWMFVTNNFISVGSRADGTSIAADAGPPIVEGNGGLIGDGIISQGANFVCSDNVILNPARYGIFYQVTSNTGGSTNITGNVIRASNANVTCKVPIYVANETDGAALISPCRISDNIIRGSGENPIRVYAYSGHITGLNISDNDTAGFSASAGGIHVRSNSGFVVSKGVIGNNYSASGGAYNIYLQGAAAGGIESVHVATNFVDGGTIGIRVSYGNNVTTAANRILNTTTPRFKEFSTNVIFGDDLPLGPERTADLVLASDAITLPHNYISFISVDTEGGAASDNLSTINGGTDGQLLVIQAASSARDVVMKDGTGNLQLAGDFTLTHVYDTITLMYRASMWREISRSDTTA